MNEELELAKVSLKNANDYADIKSNPIVESVLMPIVKAVPVIGDMIDSSMNKVIEEFQEKKEQNRQSHSTTGALTAPSLLHAHLRRKQDWMKRPCSG